MRLPAASDILHRGLSRHPPIPGGCGQLGPFEGARQRQITQHAGSWPHRQAPIDPSRVQIAHYLTAVPGLPGYRVAAARDSDHRLRKLYDRGYKHFSQ
jgi:hypothetical protein